MRCTATEKHDQCQYSNVPSPELGLYHRTPCFAAPHPVVRSFSYKSPNFAITSKTMFLLTSLLTIALGLTSVSSNSTRNCRCTSGSECWPSDSEFQTLASRVSQPLIHPAPPATPCYNSASGNCSNVRSAWNNGVWRSDQPGAAQLSNWETYTFSNGTTQACYLHANKGACPSSASTPEVRKTSRQLSNSPRSTIYAS